MGLLFFLLACWAGISLPCEVQARCGGLRNKSKRQHRNLVSGYDYFQGSSHGSHTIDAKDADLHAQSSHTMIDSLRALVIFLWIHAAANSFNPSALKRHSATSSHIWAGQNRFGHPRACSPWHQPLLGEHRKIALHKLRRSNNPAQLNKGARHRKVKRVRFPVIPNYRDFVRFQVVPYTYWWENPLYMLDCDAVTDIDWRVNLPSLNGVLQAPYPCWLLPCNDDVAVNVARLQGQLQAAGWKVLTCDPSTVEVLGNKSSLQDLAKKLGKRHIMPTQWSSPAEAVYPCILKAAIGMWGQGTRIVASAEEVLKIAGQELGSNWVLQELISGSIEFSTSLLVLDGEILDAVTTQYEYDRDAFVWPREVEEISRFSTDDTPAEYLATMSAFLKDFSGICNFNYKIRPNGDIALFEINPRLGADITCHVPPYRAAMFFEKLDELELAGNPV